MIEEIRIGPETEVGDPAQAEATDRRMATQLKDTIIETFKLDRDNVD